MRNSALLSASLLAFACEAQIVLENTSTDRMRSILTLSDGPKLTPITPPGGAFTIYNMDLSVYRVLTLPEPPVGYAWQLPVSITESLFDTDPASIEYLVTGLLDNMPVDQVIAVFREDGTELFWALPGRLQHSTIVPGDLAPGIFETPTGAKMLVGVGAGDLTAIYSLPGHVPCVSSCQPNADLEYAMGTDEHGALAGGSLTVQNPVGDRAMLYYTLPHGAHRGELTVLDNSGRKVLVEPLDDSGRKELRVDRMAAGTYLLHVSTPLGELPAAKMQVVR